MFTFASLLDPNYGLSSIEQADQPRWLARFQQFVNEEEENQPLSALVSSFQRFNDSRLSPDKLENYVETDSNSEMKNIIVKFFNHLQVVKTKFIHESDAKLAAARQLHPERDHVYNYMELIDQCKFWQELDSHSEFKLLSKIARRLLAVPATSASVERVFSQTGFITRPHRRRINDQLAEQTFFLKANIKYF
jgi:hypothetical protein